MTNARERAIQSVRQRLQRRASPRVHMLIIVTLTAACGFLSSVMLLRAGVRSMAVRYPIAVGLAYIAFLGLIALWLRLYRVRAELRQQGKGAQVELDVLDVPLGQIWSGSSVPDADVGGFGGGGGFSGGGGGASWGNGPTTISSVGDASSSSGGSSGGIGDAADGFDLDDVAAWLIPVAIIGAIAFSVIIYIVYLAPVLFAELLLNAGLAAGLYKRLMREERRSWLATAVRSTVVPACVVAVSLAVAGVIMQRVYPDAASIGVVARHLQARVIKAPRH